MRSHWTLLFSLAAVGCVAVACLGYERSRRLSGEAELSAQLSASSGQQFVETLSGEFMDQELGQLDRRRALMAQASAWRQGMLFALVGVVVFGFAAYAAGSIEPILEEAPQPLPPGTSPQKA